MATLFFRNRPEYILNNNATISLEFWMIALNLEPGPSICHIFGFSSFKSKSQIFFFFGILDNFVRSSVFQYCPTIIFFTVPQASPKFWTFSRLRFFENSHHFYEIVKIKYGNFWDILKIWVSSGIFRKSVVTSTWN